MTPKEAFEMLEKCGTNTEQPYEDMILEALYQSLTELEELKRDVKRYFGLEKRLDYIDKNANTPFEIENMKQTHRDTLKELCKLEDKLKKVGIE